MPPGETAVLRIAFEEDAYHQEHSEDLHLIDDDDRYDLSRDEDDKSNVFRQKLAGRVEPYEFFVRVANVAPKPAESEKRQYVLKLNLGEVEPCGPETMIAALNEEVGLLAVSSTDATMRRIDVP